MTAKITRRWKQATITGLAVALAAVFGIAVNSGTALSSQPQSGGGDLAQVAPDEPTSGPTPLVDCDVDLSVEYGFDTGSIYKVTITAGTEVVNRWTITWLWPDETQIKHHFDVEGLFDQRGNLVEVTEHPRYSYIAPGESIDFAFLVDTPWQYTAPDINYYCYTWD